MRHILSENVQILTASKLIIRIKIERTKVVLLKVLCIVQVIIGQIIVYSFKTNKKTLMIYISKENFLCRYFHHQTHEMIKFL